MPDPGLACINETACQRETVAKHPEKKRKQKLGEERSKRFLGKHLHNCISPM